MPWDTAEDPKTDKGVVVQHPAFTPFPPKWPELAADAPEPEYIVLRATLSDDIVAQARAAARRTGDDPDGLEYRAQLILAMVLKWRVRTRAGVWHTFGPAFLRGLAPQLKAWLQGEILKLDGSAAPDATVTIEGVEVPFRRSA